MAGTFYYKFINPDESLADFVENIGMFHNPSEEPRDIVVIPDGRIDLFLTRSIDDPFRMMLMGLETTPDQRSVPPKTLTFCISFRPLAIEYVLQMSIAGFLNGASLLPDNFWGFDEADLEDFDRFVVKATSLLKQHLPGTVDPRKRELFRLIYTSNGEMSVKDLSDKVFWSSRQINRYFNEQFGLSLKMFCKILRFRESLRHIAEGKLFPELNFADQNHFIKEVKKFSGVVPGELLKNKNDRFVLLSALKQK